MNNKYFLIIGGLFAVHLIVTFSLFQYYDVKIIRTVVGIGALFIMSVNLFLRLKYNKHSDERNIAIELKSMSITLIVLMCYVCSVCLILFLIKQCSITWFWVLPVSSLSLIFMIYYFLLYFFNVYEKSPY